MSKHLDTIAFLHPFAFHLSAELLLENLEAAGQISAFKYLKATAGPSLNSQYSWSTVFSVPNGIHPFLILRHCTHLMCQTQKRQIGALTTLLRARAKNKSWNLSCIIALANGPRGNMRKSLTMSNMRLADHFSIHLVSSGAMGSGKKKNLVAQSRFLSTHSCQFDSFGGCRKVCIT